MKKLLSIVLSLLMLAFVLSLAACGSKKEEAKKDEIASSELKFGFGIYTSSVSANSAEGETAGECGAEHTAAAVLVDADGKIVKCVIDTIEIGGKYSSAGKVEAAAEFKSKYELKDAYGMKAAGAAKEWYEQVDAFAGVAQGKSISDVKKLIAEGNKGTEDVVSAGCTIKIADFVYALEKAVNAAKATDANADNTLKLGIVTTPEYLDAVDADGKITFETTVTAAALDNESKVVVAVTDSVEVEFAFDSKGVSKFDAATVISTKRELGDNYGMSTSQYAKDANGDGVIKEWYAQADAFDAACKGLDADGIAKLVVETGDGIDELMTAGCTIKISDMVKAAVKAAK